MYNGRGRDRILIVLIYLRNQCPSGRCFSPGTTVSSTNKTDRHYVTDILMQL